MGTKQGNDGVGKVKEEARSEGVNVLEVVRAYNQCQRGGV